MKARTLLCTAAVAAWAASCGGGDESLFAPSGQGGGVQDAGADTSAGGKAGAGGAGGVAGSGGAGGTAGSGGSSGNGGSAGVGGTSGNGGAGMGGTGGASCQAPLTLCAGECVDTGADPRHCSGCNKACMPEQVCANGTCLTVEDCTKTPCTGFTWCNPSTKKCAPGCAGDGQCSGGKVCDVGTHQCVCVPGTHDCSGVCQLDTSPLSCGTSCVPCATDANGQATCVGGVCGMVCNSGYHACGLACASNSSPQSCGLLCQPCPADPNGSATCTAGVCGVNCNAGYKTCGPTCVACPTQGVATTQCSGSACVVATCLPGYWPCASGCCTFTSEAVETLTGNWRDYDIAVESTGTPHLAWLSTGGLYHGRKSGATWSKQQVDAEGYRHVSLALASSQPWIAYQSYAATSFNLKVARFSGGWTLDELTNPGCCSSSTALSIDANGRGYVAFNADYSNNGGDVRTYGRPASTWVYNGAFGYPRQWTAMDTAAESAGVQHVAYADAYSGISDIRWTGTSYAQQVVNGGTKDASVHLSIRGNVRAMVYCGSSVGLHYASYANSLWTHQQLTASASWHCDVAVDGAGAAHIVYYDSAAKKVVYRKGPGGTPAPFAEADAAGVAIAVDGANQPHMAYARNNVLHYAH